MVTTEIRGRIAIVSLDRAEKRNAFNPELVQGLKHEVEELNSNDTIRAIVIKGNGTAFSAGADLDYIQQLRSNTKEKNVQDSSALAQMFEAIYSSPKITVSAVDGYALAGGCGLAMVTDFCYASSNAQFGFTEVKIGFIPAIVMVYLLNKMSPQNVRELLLTAEIISAQRAEELGMITELIDGDFYKEVIQRVESLISKTSGQAIELTKEMLRTVPGMEHAAALEYAAEQNAKARSTEDCIKGMDAFLSKNKISW
ncbi:MAG: enoyl-CoA hydratase/isomerase family protein [Bacteroidia bacterium]